MDTTLPGRVFRTPRNPFLDGAALETLQDEAVALDADGRILVTGPYAGVRRAHADAEVEEVQTQSCCPD